DQGHDGRIGINPKTRPPAKAAELHARVQAFGAIESGAGSGSVGSARGAPVWRQFFRWLSFSTIGGVGSGASPPTGREDLPKLIPARGTYDGVRNIQQSVVKLDPQRFNIGIAASIISFLQLSNTATIQ
ncbi:MAG: hypothetical protein ACRED2_03665, partial [Methylocella sp.]